LFDKGVVKDRDTENESGGISYYITKLELVHKKLRNKGRAPIDHRRLGKNVEGLSLTRNSLRPCGPIDEDNGCDRYHNEF
jgi:hypothetical protein